MSDDKKINFVAVGKGLLTAIVITFVLMLIIAAICYFATVQDRLLALFVFVSTGISVFLGALMAAKQISSAGLLHGVMLGLGYIAMMFLGKLVLGVDFCFTQRLVAMIICIMSCSMLGGILGINTKK